MPKDKCFYVYACVSYVQYAKKIRLLATGDVSVEKFNEMQEDLTKATDENAVLYARIEQLAGKDIGVSVYAYFIYMHTHIHATTFHNIVWALFLLSPRKTTMVCTALNVIPA